MITERLKQIRDSKDLTHQQVADFLGITRQAYANYENGEREIKAETLRKLAGFFNVSADYLLGTTDDPTPLKANEEPYDSLAEITNYLESLGVKSMGFFDIEKWKNLSPEDVEDIKRHFEYTLHKAMERKKQQEKS